LADTQSGDAKFLAGSDLDIADDGTIWWCGEQNPA
jgi:hypothetical protein